MSFFIWILCTFTKKVKIVFFVLHRCHNFLRESHFFLYTFMILFLPHLKIARLLSDIPLVFYDYSPPLSLGLTF
ncbi:Protein of unknown function [Gryllus bimaculatus]|nr:Protein of unknown function [Gryllus bimaculatus]